jgi:hypothetical protein
MCSLRAPFFFPARASWRRRGPVARRPRHRAPALATSRPGGPAASPLPGGGSPRRPSCPGNLAPASSPPRPGGLVPLRVRAPVAHAPRRPPRVALRPRGPASWWPCSRPRRLVPRRGLACPDAAHVPPARAACSRARDRSCATFNFQFNPFLILV